MTMDDRGWPQRQDVKMGDMVRVRREFGSRGGQDGLVIDPPNEEGVSLDFFCDVFGDPKGLPTIEFWEWQELEVR
jgi:hypothetical protein